MTFSAKSDKGLRRSSNEDSYGYHISEDGGRSFFIVADGMGGHNAGEEASRIAVEICLNRAKSCDAPEDAEQLAFFAKETLELANAAIMERAGESPSYNGMGTTAVFCIVTGSSVVVANVGDSRAYLVAQKGCRQLTVDHSLVEDLVRGGYLDRDAAMQHPDRNLITKALGSQETAEADTFVYAYEAGDTLILCSDGLNSMVDDSMICKIVKRGPDPETICANLTEQAKKNGGADNITVIAAVL